MGKIQTIWEKIYYKFFIKFKQIDTCFCKYGNIQDNARLVFYLNYPLFIHLGDTLWFEPIARLLQMKYTVVIYCNPSIEFYFRDLEYGVINCDQILSTDTIVTRAELAYHLRKLPNNILFIDFNYTQIKKPLIEHALSKVITYLGLPIDSSYNMSHLAKPQKIIFTQSEVDKFIEKVKLDLTKNYVIFNDYMDSHKWSMSKTVIRMARKKLFKYVFDFINNNVYYEYEQNNTQKINSLSIIYAGTLLDKKRDNINILTNNCDSMSIYDLRGQTSIREAFMLTFLVNIRYYIGFDTFWLHLFNLYDKECRIMLKPGFDDVYNTQVKQYVAVPYTEYVPDELNNVILSRVIFI